MKCMNYKKIIVLAIILKLTTSVSFGESNNDYIHFLNVADGDCILIEDNNEYTLIDGGEREYSEYIIKYLKSKGVFRIKNVIYTHAHKDHTGGLIELLNQEEIEVDFVYGNPITPLNKTSETIDIYSSHSMSYHEFQLAVKYRGIQLINPKEMDTLFLGDSAKITFYNTSVSTPYNGKVNDTSLCIVYQNENDRVLLSSDIIFATEARLLNKLGRVQVLKIPHHGYNTSSSYAFLKALNPDYAILSGEKINSLITYNKYKALNIPVYSTHKLGNIILKSTGDGIVIS